MLGAPKSAVRAPEPEAPLFAFLGEREPETDRSVRGLIQTSRVSSQQRSECSEQESQEGAALAKDA